MGRAKMTRQDFERIVRENEILWSALGANGEVPEQRMLSIVASGRAEREAEPLAAAIDSRPTEQGVPTGPGVYFVRAGDIGPIKIGKATRCIARRVRSLQTASPVELVFLGALPMHTDEAILHRRWRMQRIRGEWFKATPDLLEFIASLAKGKA